jgi:glycosyltransferase involved in cell wall biosynthesis
MKRAAKSAVLTMLQPDPQVLWLPDATRVAKKLMREVPHDAILVTAPPYSSFFLGAGLKRQFKVPLILDFRDEWDLSGRYLENATRDFISRTIQSRMQRYVLSHADAVVATTMASTANLAEKLTSLKSSAITKTIYNGYDDSDFISQSPGNPTNSSQARTSFRLVYTGTLWNLTSISPLVEAIERLQSASPELALRLELVCVGRKTPEQISLLDRLASTSCRLQLVDYCEHSAVLEWLNSADAVCLLLSDVAGAERVVPAKLFEYLANRREILSIVPNGETADIVRRYFPESHFEPKDVSGICRWLQRRLSFEKINVDYRSDSPFDEFSRLNQTKRLVELLNEVATHRNSNSSK